MNLADNKAWFRPGDDEKLPLLLLCLCYGLYCFFLLLGLHLPEGISEAEEWRVYVLGWLGVPSLAIGMALATWRARQQRYAAVAGFYPVLLAFNTFFWTAGFGYFFFSNLDPDLFGTGPVAVAVIIVLYPLCSLAVLKNIQHLSRGQGLAEWSYFFLPLAALVVGVFNFGEPGFTSVARINLPWPVVAPGTPDGEVVERGLLRNKGDFIVEGSDARLSFRISSAKDGVLQPPLPWEILKGAVVTAWLVSEGQAFQAGQPFLTLANQEVEAVVSPRSSGVLGKILAPVGAGVEAKCPLYTIASFSGEAGAFLRDVILAVLLGLVSVLHPALCALRFSRRAAWMIDGLVVLVVALVVINPDFSFESAHYNFYLGPVNDLLHGRSMLVDINCQYGVLVIYFLALVFKSGALPLTYKGLAALIGILLVVQYSLVYLLLRRLLGSQLFAVLVLGLILRLSFFSQLGLAALPSIGPLRFGLTYVLLFLTVLRSWRPRLERPAQVAVWALVGLSSAWSIETFFYLLPAYLAILVWQQLPAAGIRPLLKGVSVELRWAVAAIALVHLALALDVFSRSGELPHWGRYLEYLALYSVGEFGALPIHPWSPWALIVGVYLASAVLLVYQGTYHAPGPHPPELKVVAGLTAFGLAQFTYYLGRSHPNNLYHICIPSLVLAAYWLCVLGRRREILPRRFWHAASYAIYGLGMFLLVTGIPLLSKQWGHTAAQALVSGRAVELWSSKPTDPQVEEALALVAKHAPAQGRIPIFLAPNLTTEALLLSGKANLFPLSNVEQDALLPSVRQRVLNLDPGLRIGDVFFMSRDQKVLHPLQRQIIQNINQGFLFVVEDTSTNIVVVRLRQR